MKRKADAQPEDEVVLVEKSNSDCNNDEPAANSLKRSWVWNHFELAEDGTEATCQVAVVCKGCSTVCGEKLKKDKSGSTKNFHGHLQLIHSLVNPKLSKKPKTQMDMKKWLETGTVQAKVRFILIFTYYCTLVTNISISSR
jgi:hypothetical protein